MNSTAEQLPTQTPNQFNRELRIRTDTITWLAETLHGSMRTSFEFTHDGEYLRGEDGGSMDEVFDDAIADAQRMVQENPGLLFELRRRLVERGELDDMYRLIRGELPGQANTIVTVSDFPPELMAITDDVEGYKADSKPTMLRVITLEDEGQLRITTQRLDGSNRQALEAIYDALGVKPEPGELLEQRVYKQLPHEWQGQLINNLTNTYDRSLSAQLGGEWHAGIRQQSDARSAGTYEFAMAQHDLIDWFTAEKLANSVNAEKLRYSLAAAIHERYERYTNKHGVEVDTKPGFSVVRSVVKGLSVVQEAFRAGRRAMRMGKTFSGCGKSEGGEQEADSLSNKNQLESSGYGNKTNNKNEKGVMRCVNCPKCRTEHKELRSKDGRFTCKNKKCGYSVRAG